jgi:hypothetical protein
VLTVKVLVLELGALLMYAGIKGLSVPALIRGDNTVTAPNTSLNTGSGAATTGAATSTSTSTTGTYTPQLPPGARLAS